jgi:hypothetical protein
VSWSYVTPYFYRILWSEGDVILVLS